MSEQIYNPREMPEYEDGERAFRLGLKNTSLTGIQRTAWWTGYFDERVRQLLRRIYRREVSFP